MFCITVNTAKSVLIFNFYWECIMLTRLNIHGEVINLSDILWKEVKNLFHKATQKWKIIFIFCICAHYRMNAENYSKEKIIVNILNFKVFLYRVKIFISWNYYKSKYFFMLCDPKWWKVLIFIRKCYSFLPYFQISSFSKYINFSPCLFFFLSFNF